ncbi:TPA: superantigen-like protein SSL3 [Staphylococcus aureus]|uniref:superantigen-like protein SSL3 n=1 Tax=Staphylococcus TaxID=1279 RepID=UPI001981B0CD|nr:MULTISPECIES: superantigen-like protein SSL3 [Staphylococcus]MBN4898499.1 superantigen-like protein SSL3 [Staphylococcus sp. EG-SA-21]MBN4923302.1 superantigen-like protein SSL3 [Staphylococcus sp. EG-SA-1]MDI1536500.1 superantigen-like protein SSL3 [Staphylococcus aureus]MDI1750798.1 superantigen-like protein SSL3 [Staphylococcus aureus]MDI1849836.1 superantigen-like protein SSL3 [Staphylococcus aureus]
MKMRTIAKTSLALGLLTTGAITVTTQSVKAEKIQSTKVDKVPTLKAERLAMINITAGANSATTQAANTRQERTPKLEKAPNTNEEKTSASKIEKISQPKQAEQKTLNISATPAPKQEQSQTTTESTTPKTKVTTPPSTNTPQPMQSTKSDTPQSPTIKQAQTDMTPKYEDLRAYYTKPSFEFEKQFGFMLKPWTTVRFMNVIPNRFIYKIDLVGKDEKKYKDGPYDNIDVFIVLEDNKYQLKKYSVGGITKTNSKKVNHKVELSITKKDNQGMISRDVSEYMITKEEISLKELDFKLRKQLIEKHNLYGNMGSGTIVIKMKNGGKYTFELHKKLQEHRMADVIDGTNIDNIEVNIK